MIRSALPFWGEVYGHDIRSKASFVRRKIRVDELSNSRPLCLHSAAELCRDIGKEIRQGSEGVRFKFKWKRPKVMSAIIKYNQIILIT
jgi:hypothetical protein